MTVVVTKGWVWIADADREAHAHVARGRQTRTACGQPAKDPRYAHPAATRCPRCQAVVDGPT